MFGENDAIAPYRLHRIEIEIRVVKILDRFPGNRQVHSLFAFVQINTDCRWQTDRQFPFLRISFVVILACFKRYKTRNDAGKFAFLKFFFAVRIFVRVRFVIGVCFFISVFIVSVCFLCIAFTICFFIDDVGFGLGDIRFFCILLGFCCYFVSDGHVKSVILRSE